MLQTDIVIWIGRLCCSISGLKCVYENINLWTVWLNCMNAGYRLNVDQLLIEDWSWLMLSWLLEMLWWMSTVIYLIVLHLELWNFHWFWCHNHIYHPYTSHAVAKCFYALVNFSPSIIWCTSQCYNSFWAAHAMAYAAYLGCRSLSDALCIVAKRCKMCLWCV